MLITYQPFTHGWILQVGLPIWLVQLIGQKAEEKKVVLTALRAHEQPSS